MNTMIITGTLNLVQPVLSQQILRKSQ